MTGYLFALVLLLQANPTGTVTGVVRNAAGMPAAGVRVYAMAVADPTQGGNLGNALEGLSQTDDAGRFRLEVPAGRYYIAAGSVESPTYFPGTRVLTGARVVSITSAAVIDNVDIAGFVAATRAPSDQFMVIRQMPGATGVISGVIQYADGTPAVGLYVSATPANLMKRASPAAAAQLELARLAVSMNVSVGSITSARGTQTDANGRYRFENVAPDTYYIAAGYADWPTLYPGVTDVASASPITTTPATKLDTLDFTIPQPPKGITVSGRIFGIGGAPAAGGTVQLRLNPLGGVSALLPGRPFQQATSKADGSFEIHGVTPGNYVAAANMPDASPITKNIVVTEDTRVNVEFSFPITLVSGRILLDDGTSFSDPQVIGEVAIVSGPNPNAVLTTLLPVNSEARFGRPMEAGDYRFSLRTLPVDYSIHSITSAGTDLVKDLMKVTTAAPVNIEVRLTKATNSTGNKVSGKIRDSVTGKPAAGQSVLLCCHEKGPVYSLSTRIQEDGSFEFTGVTPGVYTAQLRSRTTPALMDHAIAVGDADVSGITLLAAAELVPVTIFVVSDDGNRSVASALTITLSGSAEVVQVVRKADANTGQTMAWVPVGDSYKVTISNIPDGYIVKGIAGGDGMLMTGSRLPVMKGATANVAITLGKR